MGIQANAITAELVFLSQPTLTTVHLTKSAADLRALPPPSPIVAKVDLAERFFALDEIQVVARDGPGKYAERDGPRIAKKDDPAWERLLTRSIDWNPALRGANECCDRTVAALNIPDPAARRRETAAIAEETHSAGREASEQWELAYACTPKQLGELYGRMLRGRDFSNAHKAAITEMRLAQKHRLLTVAIAMTAYHADRRQYPPALSDLVPNYLAEAPTDIFPDTPLTYQRTAAGFLLRSVGPDGTDDQGRGPKDDPPGDDLTFELPAPPPTPKPWDPPGPG